MYKLLRGDLCGLCSRDPITLASAIHDTRLRQKHFDSTLSR